jgi:glycosyltransferase involved in cell wall biosynthesis
MVHSRVMIPGLVSVVTPAYNCADFLRLAIESALAQTYQSLEIIVVDDASDDHTADVCAKFGDRVTYIYRENDGTRGNGARARAILESRGEWVALLDHDDRWLPTKIQEQVVEISRDGRAGIVFTGAKIVDAHGLRTGEEFERGASGAVFHRLLAGQRYCASSALVRNAAIEFVRATAPEGDFLTNARHWNNDTDLWIRIARYYDVIYLDKILTEYRLHGANDSSDRTRLWATDLEMLAAKAPYLHEGCRECWRCLSAGRRALKRRLAVAHFDNFISSTVREEKSMKSLQDAFRADFASMVKPRRLGVMVKYLVRGVVSSARDERARARRRWFY